MDDVSKLDRTRRARGVPPRPIRRPDETPRRTDGRDAATEARPVNPWLLLGAGALVVLLLILFA